jgi:hypothetical protein
MRKGCEVEKRENGQCPAQIVEREAAKELELTRYVKLRLR